MELAYSSERVGEFMVFTLRNSVVNQDLTPALKDIFLIEICEGSRYIILDLSKVRYMDSSGIGALLFGQRIARTMDGEMILTGLSKPVQTILDIARISSAIRIYESVENAIREF